MSIISNFMNSVNWYNPTTDAYDWANFQNAISFGFTPTPTVSPILSSAQAICEIPFQEDIGMWNGIREQFGAFLGTYGSTNPNSAPTDDLQYSYVQCFLNNYGNAAHNNDLWQAMYDCSRTVLVCGGRPVPSPDQISRP